MRVFTGLIIIFCICCHPAKGQNPIGTLPVVNHNRFEYKADAQIWGMAQDKNGMLCFANNDGLLTYNGNHWKLYKLPNKAPVKAIAIDAAGRIYAGGQDEIGYFFPDRYGRLTFRSLKHLVPQRERQFADILGITIIRDEIFFRTAECIFRLKNNTIYAFDAPGGWRLLAEAGKNIFATDKAKGLLVLKNNQWRPVLTGPESTLDLRVTAITNYADDTLLVATLKSGLYTLHGSVLTKKRTAIDHILLNSHISCMIGAGNGRYVIGTPADGCYIIDKQGRLERKISQEEDLQNQNVLSLLADRDLNLWIGLENGIDFVAVSSAITRIYPGRNNPLTCNAARIFNGKLFIGTSNGLFSTPAGTENDISLSDGTFTEVENTKGMVLNLAEINGQLLMGHQEGAFIIEKNQASRISSRHGVWNFAALPPESVAEGTYTGLQLLNYHDKSFKDEGKIKGIYESLRFLAFDGNHTIWASHPYRGVFRLELSPDRRTITRNSHYSKDKGLPSAFNNYVYTLRHKIVAATEKGIYEYDSLSDKFKPSPFFEKIFGSQPVKYLTADSDGNIWFVTDQRVGIIDFRQSSPGRSFAKIYLPELTSETISEYGYIYPYNRENIFIGSGKGLFHINYSKYVRPSFKPKVLLQAVKAISKKDSLLFGGYFCDGTKITDRQKNDAVLSLPNSWNSFHFEYSSTLYAQKNAVEFSYKLEGFDNDWSEWSAKAEKDYTNLSYGTYTFKVKARNNIGDISSPVSYTFKILPAWYQTMWAILFYLASAAAMIYLLFQRQKRRFALHRKKYEEEQQRLRYLQQLEIDRAEKEIVELQNQNLETEVNFKNKELATVTMHLVERGKMLTKVREELISLSRRMNLPASELNPILRIIGDGEKSDKDWEQFATHFDEIHHNFLLTLKTKFPVLSSTDLKLCAYLRINLSSKEIAQLMNISVKGVEISRYRLRKKLQLPTEVNLFDFLMQING